MKKKLLVGLILLLAVVLTSCGGGSASPNIDVTFADFTFTPNAFKIPAGQEITIHAVNNGTVEHEFVIMKFGQNVGDDFGDEDENNIYWEVEVKPGEETTTTFTAPSDAGEYQVVCGTPGHFTSGMIASLTVVAP